jgi:hypothetical protein
VFFHESFTNVVLPLETDLLHVKLQEGLEALQDVNRDLVIVVFVEAHDELLQGMFDQQVLVFLASAIHQIVDYPHSVSHHTYVSRFEALCKNLKQIRWRYIRKYYAKRSFYLVWCRK